MPPASAVAVTTHRTTGLKHVAMFSSPSPPSPSSPLTSPSYSPLHLLKPLTLLLLTLAFVFPCVLFLRSSAPLPVHPHLFGREESKLRNVLESAVMVDGTVILTTLNAAWSGAGSVIDLFLESFRIGQRTQRLLDHLVIIALDRRAYERCVSVHRHCYTLETEGVDFSGEKNFMTDGYLRMMWRRIDFLRAVLEMGYNFVFTDTDVLWFRNPLPYFYSDADFQIACDHFIGISYDLQNSPNGGFNYVRSNNRTIQFYKYWYSSRLKHPGYHDQDVLNFIKRDPFLAEIGLNMRFLDTARFGGLCEPSKDFNKVCTMHVNCCIGLQRKLHDLRVMLEDWKRFMSLPQSRKASSLVSWSVPQKCSLAPLNS